MKQKACFLVLPLLGLYIILNEIFFHIALIISDKRLMAYPYLIGIICGSPTGYSSKKIMIFAVFLLARLVFIYIAKQYTIIVVL